MAAATLSTHRGTTERKDLLRAATTARNNKQEKRLKWVQPILSGEPLAIDVECGGDGIEEWIIKDSLRSIAAMVREWAGLLVLTDDGMDALFCIQSLRDSLQDLHTQIAFDSRSCGSQILYSQAAHKTLGLAVTLEYVTPADLRREFYATKSYLRGVTKHCSCPRIDSWIALIPGTQLSPEQAWAQIAALRAVMENTTEKGKEQIGLPFIPVALLYRSLPSASAIRNTKER